MNKNLYFIRTNGYDMIVSVDGEKNCRYLTETNDFPYITGMDKEEQKKIARKFLATVEDDSSWNENCTYDEIFGKPENKIIAIKQNDPKHLDLDNLDLDDLLEMDLETEPRYKIKCDNTVEYSNIFDCAKSIGDKIAHEQEYSEFSHDNIIIYCEGNVLAMRKYISKKFTKEEYLSFLKTLYPWMDEEYYNLKPVILEYGYYTDWLGKVGII